MSGDLVGRDAGRDELNSVHPPARQPGPAQGAVAPASSTGPAGGTAAAEPAWFDEVTAERLLRADTVDDPALVPVAWRLSAAAAPAMPDEMRRADAVFTAYAKRPHRRRGLLARLLGIKVPGKPTGLPSHPTARSQPR